MVELVKTPTLETFMNLVKNCDHEMILCAPFIKNQIICDIIKNKKSCSKMTVITASNISNFIQSSSDLSAIKTLLKHNITVINYQDLHAKIYLFDSTKALITSANLTYSGMNHNYEYGVLIDKDEKSMEQIEKDFIEMLDSKFSGEFDSIKIEDIEKAISKIEKSHYFIKEINGENTLIVDDLESIFSTMTPWQKDIFLIISSLNNEFSLKEIYEFKNILSKKHPKNNNIEAKTRQILQQLRDMGLVKFTRSGRYKKLFLQK